MIQEIVEMMKLLDHQHKHGADGERTDRRPSLEELLAYLHQANASGSGVDLPPPKAGSGLSANFEEIIAQHIALNGNARQQAALQQQQAKRKQAKRSPGSGVGSASVGAAAVSAQALRNAMKNVSYPDELVQEVFTDDERTVALFRSLGAQDGVSVEFHRMDDDAPAGSKGGKGSKKSGSSASSGTTLASKKTSSAAVASAPPSSTSSAAVETSATSDAGGASAMYFGCEDGDDLVDVGDDVMVHEEDLHQINHMIQSLEPLSQETLEELSSEWSVSFPNGGEHLLYRTNITERIRFLAATMVVGVADRFQVLQNNHVNPEDAERERMVLVNNLVLSLWHGINVLAENVRKNFAVIFGLDADSTAHDVCVAVAGLGIAAFFEPLPLSLIEKVCRELGLPPVDSKTDPDLVHEALAHRICAHFYPALGRLPDMNLKCTTQLTVHENGPGSYTCTIDNALLMDLVMRQIHTSNKFACRKVKWRARVEVSNGELCFSVVHHDAKAYNVAMVVRTSEKGKKKKLSTGLETDTTVSGQSGVGGLYLEKRDVAMPGQPVGFRNIVSVQQVYRHLTTNANGLRLYNRIEDRVIFQFSMEITPNDDATKASSAASVAEEKQASAAAAVAAGAASKNKSAAAVATGTASAAVHNTVDPSSAGQTIAELIEQEEREKREKLAAKQREKNSKRTKQLELTESQAREQLLSQQATSHAQLMSECSKSYQKASQKKKDRERKQELAKATPSSELLTQLTTLEQAVRQARSAFSKLAAEKSKEDKEIASLTNQIETRNEELANLQTTTEENESMLEKLQADIAAAEERIAAKNKAIEQKKERQQLRRKRSSANAASITSAAFGVASVEDPSSSSLATAATLSIKDFQSFWSISSTSVPTSSSATTASGGAIGGLGMGPTVAIGSSSAFGNSNMPTSAGAAAINMGLDLSGAFGMGGPPSMPPSMMGGNHMGRHAHTQQFSLNGDAPPFYGSSYGDSRSGMNSGMGGVPQPPQRSPLTYVGASGVQGNPMNTGVPFTPPGGFSPYGMGRLSSPAQMPGNNMVMGTGGPLGPAGPRGGPLPPQQQPFPPQVNHPTMRNPGAAPFRGGYGGGMYGDTF